jgi:16S rRNA U1498 N3-methylase RsmE
VTANRFFLPQPALPDSVLWIEGAEHHHLSRVARVRQGETIGLFNEEGRQYRAVVEKVALKKTLVRECGFRPVSLGRSVLRTETAALCAAFLVNHFWNP